MIDAHPDPRHLAASPDAAPAVARLAACPARLLPDGSYVVARREDVTALLDDPLAEVAFRRDPDPRIAGVQDAMARFTDGDDHRRLRERTVERIGVIDAGHLRESAAALVATHVDGMRAVDVVPLARRLPVLALAEALGIESPERTVDAVDLLVRRLAPVLVETARPRADEVVAALEESFGRLDVAAVDLDLIDVAVLLQTVDATAALIAHRLAADGAPPIHTTTRALRAPAQVGGQALPAGAHVVVALGAAALADEGLWFGHGRHACPGREVAEALADGFIDGLTASGLGVHELEVPTAWEPRPNLRLPVSLVLRGP